MNFEIFVIETTLGDDTSNPKKLYLQDDRGYGNHKFSFTETLSKAKIFISYEYAEEVAYKIVMRTDKLPVISKISEIELPATLNFDEYIKILKFTEEIDNLNIIAKIDETKFASYLSFDEYIKTLKFSKEEIDNLNKTSERIKRKVMMKRLTKQEEPLSKVTPELAEMLEKDKRDKSIDHSIKENKKKRYVVTLMHALDEDDTEKRYYESFSEESGSVKFSFTPNIDDAIKFNKLGEAINIKYKYEDYGFSANLKHKLKIEEV